jgi:hypothetical protein
MAMTQAEKARLNALQQEADAALKRAREARVKVTAAFVACAAGKGAGPGEEALKEADELDAQADEAWAKFTSIMSFFT